MLREWIDTMDGVILVSAIVTLAAVASTIFFHYYFKKHRNEARKEA